MMDAGLMAEVKAWKFYVVSVMYVVLYDQLLQ